ncbi:MAG: hypothetical protein HKL87_03160 [Acidimicrobiaceae bacterium]|nr:hypothetical protein [Acidimicrobiaceae bacterium]
MDVVHQILDGDVSFFPGETAPHATGWLRHPEIYLGEWLETAEASLPRRHRRTILLGMGGSSSPARFYADWRLEGDLQVLDTTNPDTLSEVDFSSSQVIASSKSGGTVETQTLLAHALAHGLVPEDLVIITDPGTTLAELGESLGARVIYGDPETGGRYSSLSPFGLVPALYAGWSVDELREELAACALSDDLVAGALHEADRLVDLSHDGWGVFALGADPIASGAALWLEQLVAETTGKDGRGFVPVQRGPVKVYRPSEMMHYHLVAAFLAYRLGVDPFNQPDVESTKKEVFAILQGAVEWTAQPFETGDLRGALESADHRAVQAFAPFSAGGALSELRHELEATYGTTSANLGPRYLHSTGQLHKGGPRSIVGLQVIQRPTSAPTRIEGRAYSFHDLHMAQAIGDYRAMRHSGRAVYQIMVDDLTEASNVLGL